MDVGDALQVAQGVILFGTVYYASQALKTQREGLRQQAESRKEEALARSREAELERLRDAERRYERILERIASFWDAQLRANSGSILSQLVRPEQMKLRAALDASPVHLESARRLLADPSQIHQEDVDAALDLVGAHLFAVAAEQTSYADSSGSS